MLKLTFLTNHSETNWYNWVCVTRYNNGEFHRPSSEKNNIRTSEVHEDTDVDDEGREKSDQQKKVTNDSETEKMKKMTMVPERRRSGAGQCLRYIYCKCCSSSSCSPVNPMVTMRLKYDVFILVCHVQFPSLPSCSVVNNSGPLVYYWSTSCMDDLCSVFPVYSNVVLQH